MKKIMLVFIFLFLSFGCKSRLYQHEKFPPPASGIDLAFAEDVHETLVYKTGLKSYKLKSDAVSLERLFLTAEPFSFWIDSSFFIYDEGTNEIQFMENKICHLDLKKNVTSKCLKEGDKLIINAYSLKKRSDLRKKYGFNLSFNALAALDSFLEKAKDYSQIKAYEIYKGKDRIFALEDAFFESPFYFYGRDVDLVIEFITVKTAIKLLPSLK